MDKEVKITNSHKKLKAMPVAKLVTPRTHSLSRKYNMRGHVKMRPYQDAQYLDVNS